MLGTINSSFSGIFGSPTACPSHIIPTDQMCAQVTSSPQTWVHSLLVNTRVATIYILEKKKVFQTRSLWNYQHSKSKNVWSFHLHHAYVNIPYVLFTFPIQESRPNNAVLRDDLSEKWWMILRSRFHCVVLAEYSSTVDSCRAGRSPLLLLNLLPSVSLFIHFVRVCVQVLMLAPWHVLMHTSMQWRPTS